jgi:hypothetical protein
MPSPDYGYRAYVCAASPGPEDSPTTGNGPKGEYASKSQTTLDFALTDVRAWAEHFRGDDGGHADVVDHHVVLESATSEDLRDALAEAAEKLDFYFDESRGGSLNFVYSGHGTTDGDLVLADRLVSPDELMEWCSAGRAGEGGKTRHLQMVIDSCYSGLTLCRMVLHPAHWSRLVIRDGFAACLPSEEAFELRSLKHSVLTYTALKQIKHMNIGMAQHISADDVKQLKRGQRETSPNLTNGQQHSLDIINGHYVSLRDSAGSDLEIPDDATVEQLAEALDALPRRKGRGR